jgi:hypothetical protein
MRSQYQNIGNRIKHKGKINYLEKEDVLDINLKQLHEI